VGKRIKIKAIVIFLCITTITLGGAFLILDKEKIALDDQVRSSLSGNFIKLADGVVHFEYSDSQNGPIVVLVPGFSTPSYIWDPTYDFLENQGYRVLRFDLYGRGYSDRPNTNYTLDLYNRQIHELLSYLEIENEPINLMGLSLGGPIVTSYINQYPDNIQTLTLIDPLTSPTSHQEIFPLNLPLIGEYITAVYLAPFMLPETQASDFYMPENFPNWEEKYRDQLQYKGFRRAILSTIRNMVDISGIEQYKSLQPLDIPMLLLWGENDQSIPFTDMEKIMSVLPNIEFHPIPKAAHLPHYEQSEIVNPIISDFLSAYNDDCVFPPAFSDYCP